MFTAALFIKANIWKQPKCPVLDKWIYKIQHTYIYIHIYVQCNIYSAMNNMDGIMLSEISQILYDFTSL